MISVSMMMRQLMPVRLAACGDVNAIEGAAQAPNQS